ncbi:MAG: class I SAM-dependent methyltransferase [Acidobacteriota bacterium]|nr:class I SAM-dependent methyltransferase [Acidobacteriota bacterium]
MISKLDIGCGRNKLSGSIGLDIVPLEGVDIVHNLEQYPYPFEDNTFEYIRLSHVIEHLQSILKTMEEIHRIARPDALVEIITPHYTDSSSWQDPTHIWHLNSRAFGFFEEDFKTNHYSKVRFKITYSEVKLLKLYRWLGLEFLVNLQNRSSHFRFFRNFWEHYLCYIIRGKVMTFRLKVIK